MKRKGQCARPLFAERANQVPQKVKHLITVREFVPIDLITKQIASEKIWLIKLRSEQRKRNEFDGQKNMPIPVIDKNRIFRIGPWQWEYGHLHSVPDGPWFRTFISRWCDFAVHVQIEIRRRPRGFFAFFLLHILNTDERASARLITGLWVLMYERSGKRHAKSRIRRNSSVARNTLILFLGLCCGYKRMAKRLLWAFGYCLSPSLSFERSLLKSKFVFDIITTSSMNIGAVSTPTKIHFQRKHTKTGQKEIFINIQT